MQAKAGKPKRYTCRESNPNLGNRNPIFYPLNYRCISKKQCKDSASRRQSKEKTQFFLCFVEAQPIFKMQSRLKTEQNKTLYFLCPQKNSKSGVVERILFKHFCPTQKSCYTIAGKLPQALCGLLKGLLYFRT